MIACDYFCYTSAIMYLRGDSDDSDVLDSVT